MVRMRESVRRAFEWLSHIHTAVWIVESVGMGALISITLAAAQRLLRSPVSWLSIILGFIISSLIIYVALLLHSRGDQGRAVEISGRDLDRDVFVKFISTIEPAGAEPILTTGCPIHVSGSSEVSLPDVTALFRALGVLEISEKGRPRCVSESAEAFLASLRAHFLDGNDRYFGDWSAGTEQPRLAAMLEQWERYRTEVRGRPHVPSRKVQTAVALIRADHAGQPRFIMLENPKWNRKGAWWFVGGGPKIRDKGNLCDTVIRETCEELAVQPADLGPPYSRGTASDRRISKRIGLDTEYLYEAFALQIVRSKQELLVLEGKVQTERRIEHFRWVSWDEILNSNHLKEYASSILRLLEHIDPRSIPQSGELRAI